MTTFKSESCTVSPVIGDLRTGEGHVLKMVDVEYIKKRQEDGWSIRKIARQLEVSRQTVRKLLAAPAEPPQYRQQRPRPAPVMGPYLGVVQSWLAADETAPRKQRHTAKRVFDRLVTEYGFAGSEVTVRRAVRTLRGRQTEVFVPLEAVPGKVAQADFGQESVLVAGRVARRESMEPSHLQFHVAGHEVQVGL